MDARHHGDGPGALEVRAITEGEFSLRLDGCEGEVGTCRGSRNLWHLNPCLNPILPGVGSV